MASKTQMKPRPRAHIEQPRPGPSFKPGCERPADGYSGRDRLRARSLVPDTLIGLESGLSGGEPDGAVADHQSQPHTGARNPA